MKISGVEITHPDKILFPEAKITKEEMVRYYQNTAEKILPYLKDRPLTLQRFPEGISHEGFYQKEAPEYFPSYLRRVRIKTRDGEIEQIVCNIKKGLIYLANQGTVTFHIWPAKRDMLHRPDKIIFDLDPPEGGFEKVRKAAHIIGQFLREQGKDPQLMTTGQSGLHVWYKIRRTKDFDRVREEVKTMAGKLANNHPRLLTTAVRKDQREGRIFIDYLRNSYGQTSVCPYSVRPNKEAGLAMPVSWQDLEKLTSGSDFTLKDS